MRIAYLDCFSGISGDMFLGALVDVGVPIELFEQTVASLNVGATLEQSRVERSGVSATKIDVLVNGQKDLLHEVFWAKKSSQEINEHDIAHRHTHGRHLSHILKIISAAQISDGTRQKASDIFRTLGDAESKVHGVPVEKIHFHEVGAADAIVDIVCAAVGAEALQVEQILCSSLNVGGGTVQCAHGLMPVPAPATMELLKGVPQYSGAVQKELVTPTGAAIVRVLASNFGTRPLMAVERTGYGAGARDFPGHPNVLRLMVGQALESDDAVTQSGDDEVVEVLEANLDDLSPEVIGYVCERLLAEGALDVFATAVQMKKGRPGILLTVLCHPQGAKTMRGILLHETSTLGVRSRRERRRILDRRYELVLTQWGEVRIKIGSTEGRDTNAAPEYEDCRRIAVERRVPLKSVMLEALRLYLEKKNG